MSIDRLSSTSSLIAALRAEVARKSGRARGGGSAQDAPAASTPRDARALRRELAVMVKGIDVDDEAAMKQARSRVIRAVLLWEFGPQLREYDEWQPMIETLTETLERSEAHRDDFKQMVRDLRTHSA